LIDFWALACHAHIRRLLPPLHRDEPGMYHKRALESCSMQQEASNRVTESTMTDIMCRRTAQLENSRYLCLICAACRHLFRLVHSLLVPLSIPSSPLCRLASLCYRVKRNLYIIFNNKLHVNIIMKVKTSFCYYYD
jgi:hypothetical protein